MTNAQIARHLRQIAAQKPTDIWHALHQFAMDLEQEPRPVPPQDMEALVRATQPSTRRPGLLSTLLGRRR